MRSPKAKLLIAYILLLAIAYFMSACGNSRKVQKAKDVLAANPAELAKLCADKFPAKETTIYLPGEVVRDTMYEFQELYVPVECPPSDKDTIIQWKVKNIRETVKETKVDTINKVTVDKAKEYALNAELSSLRADMEKMEGKLAKVKKTRNWLLIALIAIALLAGVWAYFKIRTAGLRGLIK